jgi:hypothetical protein
VSAGFTPAPWEAAELGDYGDYDGHCRVILGDDIRIAVVLHGGSPAMCEENDANARLIAAAPDLYEALDRVVHKFGGVQNPPLSPGQSAALQAARDALAKARGETA